MKNILTMVDNYLKIRKTSKCIGQLNEVYHRLSFLDNMKEVKKLSKIVVKESVLGNDTIGINGNSYNYEWNMILSKMKLMSTREDGYEVAKLIKSLVDKIKEKEEYIKGFYVGGIFVTIHEYALLLATLCIIVLIVNLSMIV